jgi:hypothetical protein
MRKIMDNLKQGATIAVGLPLAFVALVWATIGLAVEWVVANTVERVVRH